MSTFVSIMIYSAGVLAGLIGLSVAFILAAHWLVRHTDQPDPGH